jgi:hypothetical protein
MDQVQIMTEKISLYVFRLKKSSLNGWKYRDLASCIDAALIASLLLHLTIVSVSKKM